MSIQFKSNSTFSKLIVVAFLMPGACGDSGDQPSNNSDAKGHTKQVSTDTNTSKQKSADSKPNSPQKLPTKSGKNSTPADNPTPAQPFQLAPPYKTITAIPRKNRVSTIQTSTNGKLVYVNGDGRGRLYKTADWTPIELDDGWVNRVNKLACFVAFDNYNKSSAKFNQKVRPKRTREAYSMWVKEGYLLGGGALSPDGTKLACLNQSVFVDFGPSICLWDLTALKPKLINVYALKGVGFNLRWRKLVWSSNSKTVLAQSGKGVAIWPSDGSASGPLSRIDLGDQLPVGAAFVNDNKQVVVQSEDSPPRVFDAGSGQLIKTLELPGKPSEWEHRNGQVASTTDQTLIATSHVRRYSAAGQSNTQNVFIWDPSAWSARHVMTRPNQNGKLVGFSGDNSWLVTREGSSKANRVVIWDTKTGKVKHELSTSDVESIVFHSDRQRLITGGAGYGFRSSKPLHQVSIWDLASGKPTALATEGFITRVDLLRDGKTLITGNKDGEILVWDLLKRANANPAN